MATQNSIDTNKPIEVSKGGSGASSLTDHGLLLGSGTGAITALAEAADGQIPIGSTGNDCVLATITAGANIGITNAAGSITADVNGTTDHAIQIGNAAGSLTSLGVATDGQLLIGSTAADMVPASLTSTSGTISYTAGAGTLDLSAGDALLTPSGFESWGGAGNYYDDTTIGQFTVLRPGTGYIKGVPISWAGSQTETGLTTGNTYFIYIDSAGTIGKATTYNKALVGDNIVLFEVLRDSTAVTNVQITVKENHPFQFPWCSSVWAHDTIGTVISGITGGANITLNGTQKIEISGADELEDHGLETDIPDSGGTAEVFEQYFTLGSGKWARDAQSDTFDGTYNNGGVATALGANKFSVNRLYVSKDDITSPTPRYFSVMGDAQYNNLVAAQTAIADGSIPTATAELAKLEMAQLGYIIFEQSSVSIVQVIISKETARTSFSGATATTASLVLTDTTNFDGILSGADTTSQSAFETIDDWGKTASRSFLTDSGTAIPALEQITISGAGTILTAGSGSTVTISGGGVTWTEVTGTSQAMAINTGYIANNAALVTATLPATAAVGSTIRIIGLGAGGFKIAQNASQYIRWDESTVTTTGVGGSIDSTDDHDAIELICTVVDDGWGILSSKGNLSIT